MPPRVNVRFGPPVGIRRGPVVMSPVIHASPIFTCMIFFMVFCIFICVLWFGQNVSHYEDEYDEQRISRNTPRNNPRIITHM